MPSVLFTTKTWRGDADKIIMFGGFERKHQACLYSFDSKWLLINNGLDKPCDDWVKNSTGADRVIFAQDYAEEVLDFFKLKQEDMKESYYYSICELVELYLAKDFDYLCHFASDTLMRDPYDWVTPSIDIMERREDIITTAPNNQDSWCYGIRNQMFSDQCYLLKLSAWRDRETFTGLKPDLNNYPAKGGDYLFERRAGRHMHNTNKYRMLIVDCWYNHPAW